MISVAAELYVIGTGDHARVVVETAQAAGVTVKAVLEPDAQRPIGDGFDGVRVTHGIDAAARPGSPFIVAIGDNHARRQWYERLLMRGARPTSLVHPHAILLAGARVGAGSHVCAGAVIGVDASVGDNVIVNTRASLDHDVEIGDHAFVGPGALLAGRVVVGEGVHVGIGSTIIEGRTIGPWSFVAAGAAVVHDVPESVRVAGVPAREMRRRPADHGDPE